MRDGPAASPAAESGDRALGDEARRGQGVHPLASAPGAEGTACPGQPVGAARLVSPPPVVDSTVGLPLPALSPQVAVPAAATIAFAIESLEGTLDWVAARNGPQSDTGALSSARSSMRVQTPSRSPSRMHRTRRHEAMRADIDVVEPHRPKAYKVFIFKGDLPQRGYDQLKLDVHVLFQTHRGEFTRENDGSLQVRGYGIDYIAKVVAQASSDVLQGYEFVVRKKDLVIQRAPAPSQVRVRPHQKKQELGGTERPPKAQRVSSSGPRRSPPMEVVGRGRRQAQAQADLDSSGAVSPRFGGPLEEDAESISSEICSLARWPSSAVSDASGSDGCAHIVCVRIDLFPIRRFRAPGPPADSPRPDDSSARRRDLAT